MELSRFINQKLIESESSNNKKLKIDALSFVMDNKFGHLESMIISHISKWHKNDNIDDLRKARYYLEKLISNNI